MAELSGSAQRVQDALTQLGIVGTVVRLPASTRTAPEAAAAVGCQVGQIAKSLVFRATSSDTPILVIASGSNRVNEARLAELVGEPIGKADAAFVRAHTGYAIGGVAPVGHPRPLRTFIDADLLAYAEIWAAAGTPDSVFALAPADLSRLTGGEVATLT
ncbi:YbaK/EbsC family protein [Chloroflexales bacterium ZM16-3]|nr:YbaK/EbsC family protein [Chloroflexales bacterium ZM16-3]